MNSRERMQLAMKKQIPDRVPVMCQLSWGHILLNSGIRPSDFFFNGKYFAEAMLTMREMYNFDGVLVNNQFANRDEDFRKSLKIEVTNDAEICTLPNGDQYYCPFYDDPRFYPAKKEAQPDINDVDVSNIKITDPIPDYKVEAQKILVAKANGQFSVHGETSSPFDLLIVLMGIENALMSLLLDPDKVHELLNLYTEQQLVVAKAQIDVGVDAMKISSPFVGSSFISKEAYAEFVLPYEKRFVQQVHKYKPGIPVYTHTCGFIGDRLELMAESEIDGIECLDPAPLGNVDLSDAKKRIGSNMFIKGNMDSVNVLLRATPEQLEEYVKKMIEDGAKNGGYILSSACSVAPKVRPEILKLLVPLAEKYGRY
jgi:uroporphyrinogen decarboxylase